MEYQSQPVVSTPIEGGMRVAVKGAVHTNTAWLETEFKRVAAMSPKVVELDLSEMPYVSSSGLTAIIEFRRNVVKAGGKLRIVSIQKAVHGAFTYASLHRLMEIDPAVVVPNKA